MKNNEASLFVFIACIIVGILISLNINFNRTGTRVFLTTKQYQDAYEQRTKLRNDISNLNEQYSDLQDKLIKYKLSGKDQSTVDEELNNELLQNKMFLGEEDVDGQGIILTLKDISNDLFYNTDDPNLVDKIIHNFDLNYILNDLKNAGAEAIEINGQRITDRTDVYCDGTLIAVNGVKIATPFYINAIGKKEVLKNYMLADDNYLKYMMGRSNGAITVDIQESDNVKVSAYNINIDKEFLNPVKSK